MPGFNARARVDAIDLDNLPEIIALCHLYGVRAYVAWNIVLFPSELQRAAQLIPRLAAMAPDAIIVQDIGLARLIGQICPDLPLHASTQMSVTGVEAMEVLEDLGLQRYIVARELSLDHLQQLQPVAPKPLEVFIHGALCISYSGQCGASHAMGGRSANRGQCAQSCRLPYQLVVDGVTQAAGFHLSPRDLCALEQIPALQALGIASLKIEGRLKSPHYIAAAVQAYRCMLDGEPGPQERQQLRETMALTFSREFCSGWLTDEPHQLIQAVRSGDQGLLIGTVEKVEGRRLTLQQQSSYTPQPGDGMGFVHGQRQWGGPVYQVQSSGNSLTIVMAASWSAPGLQPGALALVNQSTATERTLEQSWKDEACLRRIPLQAQVSGAAGKVLKFCLRDRDGHEVQVDSQQPMEAARTVALDKSTLQRQLGAMGRTPFSIESWQIEIADGVYLPGRALKQMRQEAVAQITALRSQRPHLTVRDISPCQKEHLPATVAEASAVGIHLVLRQPEQLAVLPSLPDNVHSVTLDWCLDDRAQEFLTSVRNHGFAAGWCSPAVIRPGDMPALQPLLDLQPDRILVRGLGALGVLRRSTDAALIGDTRFNVANGLSADYLLAQGLHKLSLAGEVPVGEIGDLSKQIGAQYLEVPVFSYPATFHMSYCLFAQHWSQSQSFPACGTPCRRRSLALQDRKGVRHHVRVDDTCANTLYLGQIQRSALTLPQWHELGVRDFRVEVLNESSSEVVKLLESLAGS
nr:U32 family peptidase [Desulfurispira natronophila]